VAKATTAPPGKGPKGQPVQPRAEQGNYFAGVIQELRKTTWPTGRELTRMTQIVALTVVMFAFLIGGLDLVLSYAVKPLYTQIGTAQPTLSLPAAPITIPTAKASPATSPAASPASSPAASPAASPATSPATSPPASPAPNASPTP
jgi:preprotein translocase SecE subunit